jgi:hypothetical protein
MERKQWWGLEVRYTFIMIKFNVYLERSYYILYDCREFKVLWLYRVHMGITQQCCNVSTRKYFQKLIFNDLTMTLTIKSV